MPIAPNDKSISITIGLNNLGFWRPRICFRRAKKYGFITYFLALGWITVWINAPALYHANAFFIEENERLKKKLEEAQNEPA